MKYDLDELSELALLLNFILAKAFYSKGLESKLRTSLSILNKSLYINKRKTDTILTKIEDAFNEIHKNQFLKYKFEVVLSSNPEKTTMDITILNHDKIKIEIIKKMLKENARMLVSFGYETTFDLV